MANRNSRIVIPIYQPSYDGRYWGPYPNGNKPNAGAALAGDAAIRASVAAALSTQIPLGGGASCVSTSLAGLSTAIRLAAAASARSIATATLPSTFVPDAGWSVSGTFDNGQTLTVNRPAADLGTAPNVVLYAEFRGNTLGANVANPQQIGTFSEFTNQTDTGGPPAGSRPPKYAVGPDGQSWMNLLTPELQAVGDGCVAQANMNGLDPFSQFYFSMHTYSDTPSNASTSLYNEKTAWMTLDTLVDGTGHDMFWSMNRAVGGNSGDVGFYFGGSGSDDHQGDPSNVGYTLRNVESFTSYALKPHTVAGPNALYDAFHQHMHALERFLSTSTGLKTTWASAANSARPYWNQLFLLGYRQDRGAAPVATYYLVNKIYFATGPNSWKRFFVTDAPTLAASRKCWDCPFEFWVADQTRLNLPFTETAMAGKALWYGNGVTFSRVGLG